MMTISADAKKGKKKKKRSPKISYRIHDHHGACKRLISLNIEILWITVNLFNLHLCALLLGFCLGRINSNTGFVCADDHFVLVAVWCCTTPVYRFTMRIIALDCTMIYSSFYCSKLYYIVSIFIYTSYWVNISTPSSFTRSYFQQKNEHTSFEHMLSVLTVCSNCALLPPSTVDIVHSSGHIIPDADPWHKIGS